MGDAPVNSLRVAPVLEVVMVRKDDDWVGAPNEKMSPIFKASDNGQEFSVVDIVVSFGGVKCLGVVPYRPLSPRPFVFLV